MTLNKVLYPDGTIYKLSHLDSGVLDLFDEVISCINLLNKDSGKTNKEPLDEIKWRLMQAKFCYTSIRSLHASSLAHYFEHLNSENSSSAPVIILSPKDPVANIVAGSVIIALQINIEAMYLFLSRVIEIFRKEDSLKPYKTAIEDAGKGCLKVLNQLVKHSSTSKWNEHGLYTIPADLKLGISIKPNTTELKDGEQDDGTLINSNSLLNALLEYFKHISVRV